LSTKLVFDFDEPSDGGRALLGGKGIGLAEMTQLGMPVPAGFTITTDACRAFMRDGDLPAELAAQIGEHVRRLESKVGKTFGSHDDPLLVSVRSGAAISMPGMMDTILNLGLNDEAAEGLAGRTGNARFAYDSYRRLIQMFGETAEGIDGHAFESALSALKAKRGIQQDTDLSADDLKELVESFKVIFKEHAQSDFPSDAREQLLAAVRAVFRSWNTPRAKVYRRAQDIPDDLGTAVNIVQMVFGNKGDRSGTGVAFTRDPSTGEKGVVGEYLANAQGEDVVAGIRTPRPLEVMRETMPAAYRQFIEAAERLEAHYRDVQDVEFTVEDDKLYLLQTRAAKRTAAAALRAAAAMVDEGLITREEAIRRVDTSSLDQLLHPIVDPTKLTVAIAAGLNASPGAAVGRLALTTERVQEYARQGDRSILVRWETTPDDIEGMLAAEGILTGRGGMTSHAAVVARGMGKPCIVGCADIGRIDFDYRHVTIGSEIVPEGGLISIDGTTGRVFLGEISLIAPRLNDDFETILGWADDARRLKVRANADNPEDAARAREFGAQGIGLCRTEHMFFGEERLPIVQEMILAEDDRGREAALDRLLPFQQSDFEGIFEAMAGLPVTIRLLDPPLHEFLPAEAKATDERMRARIRALHEQNPMLGTRGCRIGLLYPEIYEMQIRAIARAAKAVQERSGAAPLVEVMHPLVGFGEELRRLCAMTEHVWAEEAPGIAPLVGTMIEVPRAAIRADEIAERADFFSFGTNDLTQTTLAFSRDDAEGKFLTAYLHDGILQHNPFVTLDISGVGDLIRIAVDRGRGVKPDLKLGICGEHGGDPPSIAFCEELGLDYVSCSPFRVPLARLAAAQAALDAAGTGEYVAAGG
jgi:pyruvate,orthophosphate dikinase